MAAAAPNLRVRYVDPDRDHAQAQAAIAEFGLGGRELADGVLLVRSGQGASLRKAHLLPADLVTYATGPDVQQSGPRVREFRGEEALLGRFLAVSDPRRSVVCATQGHGEPALDSLEPYSGMAHLRDLLRDAGLEVRVADLEAAGCENMLAHLPPHYRHMVTRCIAVNANAQPDFRVLETRPGDTYVLCSDGVHDVLGGDAILDAVHNAGCAEASERVVARADPGAGRERQAEAEEDAQAQLALQPPRAVATMRVVHRVVHRVVAPPELALGAHVVTPAPPRPHGASSTPRASV